MVDKNALIKDYQNLSFYHIKLARLMRNHGQFKTAVVLCNWALTSMIRAFCIYENHERLGDEEIFLIKIAVPLQMSLCLGLDVMTFVDKLNFLINEEETKLELMERNEMDQILYKTEKVLVGLYGRMKDQNSSDIRMQALRSYSANE